MASRVSARGMIGRSAELAELEAALSEASDGNPSIAFVAGESGLGKTRLIDELAKRARSDHGARVLIGDCVELGDDELPYAPLVTALRPLAGNPVLDTLPPAVRADLGAIALGLAPADDGSDGRRDADGPPQARLFEALLTLLTVLSADAPLVLVIEDLHWADRSTRSFLTFLAANLCREQVLVVGSYRPDELHRRHPLRPLLAELERDSRARRIELSPMTREELCLQLTDILGAEAPSDLVDRLFRRTEGNPLFCEELLASGLDGRGALPSTLRDALMVRIERLDPSAQEVLRLVAVARTLDHATLAASGDVAPDVLREAIAGHILITNGDGHYAFRHALLREVVDDDLLPGERANLHLKLAHALEGRAGERPSAQLLAHMAHHYAQSGDQPAALASAIRAAEAAMPVHAYGEAAAFFERALELWERVPDAESLAQMDLVSVLTRTAYAYDLEGDNAREEALLRRALTLVKANDDPVQTAVILERLSRSEWQLNQQDESLATLDRAMALTGDEPSAHHAALLASKTRYLMLMGRFRSAVEVGEEALAEARLTGARSSESRTANALGVALTGLGQVDDGVAALNDAVRIAREDGRIADLCGALVNLSDVLHLAGRTTEALEIASAGYAEADGVGRRSVWLSLAVSEFAFELGDWALAEESLPDARRRMQGNSLVNELLRRIELALGRGDHAAAGEFLDAADCAAEGSREPQFLGPLGATRAEYARRTGDLQTARAAVADALDRIEFCTDDIHRIAHVAAVGVRVEADAAQQARDLGDPDAEALAIAAAQSLLERVRAAGEGDAPVEAAYLKTALAEAQRAAGHDDPAAWATASDAWEQLSRPYAAAQARARQAEAFAGSDRQAAADAAAAALETADELGAGWLAAELRGLIERARLPGTVASVGGVEEPAEQEDPFGLTARERQVLALVARGATNREIGGELFMAEKTASVHVSRILSKLDVRSRTEAAAVAHRLGLYAG